MLGSGGVPAYCARRSRGEGEPDMLRLSLTKSLPVPLGFEMFTAFDGVGLSEGEDMGVPEREVREACLAKWGHSW